MYHVTKENRDTCFMTGSKDTSLLNSGKITTHNAYTEQLQNAKFRLMTMWLNGVCVCVCV